ncbi:MAG: type IV pilus modification PilV family protein [Roseibacillus sp.]
MKIQRSALEQPSGFSLIVTVTMMVLLSLIAVGLLSLSSATLRATSASQSQLEAQANARLALIQAIGALQKYAGPDQRVTGTSGLLGPTAGEQHWTGVWGTQAEDGEPAWLVSGNETLSYNDLDGGSHPAGYHTPNGSSDKSIVVFSGNKPEDEVRVPLVDLVADEKVFGRYAWWVSDEGTKTRVDLKGSEKPSEQQRLANASVTQEAFFESFGGGADQGELAFVDSPDFDKERLPTIGSLDLFSEEGAGKISNKFRHELTLGGYGLPVNVIKGGMKADLSVVFDSSQQENTKMLSEHLGAMPTAKRLSRRGAPIYDFSDIEDAETFFISPEASSERGFETGPNWGNLYNFGRLWEHVADGSAAPFSFNPGLSSDLRTNDWAPYSNHDSGTWSRDIQHTNSSLQPVLAMMQMGFRIAAKPAPIPGTDPQRMGNQLQLQMKPLLGFWNPYNVKIQAKSIQVQWALYPHIRINADCPRIRGEGDHHFTRERRIRTNVWMREHWKQGGGVATADNDGSRLLLQTPDIDFEPGEFLLFSVGERADMERVNKLVPTWSEEGGFDFDLVYSEASQGDGTNDQDEPGEPIIVPDSSEVFYGGAYLEDSVKPRTREYFGDDILDGVTSSYITVGGGAQNIAHRISDIWQPMTESGRDSTGVQNGNTYVVPEPVVSTWVKTGGASAADRVPVGLLALTPYHIGTWRFFTRTATDAKPASGDAGSQQIRTWVDSNPRFGPMNPLWDGSETTESQEDGFHFISPLLGGTYDSEPWDGGPPGRGLVAEGQDEAGAFPEATLSNGRYRMFGGFSTSSAGNTHVPLFDVPRAPLVSLGQFQHAQLSRYGFEPAFPFGNSYASIRIPLEQTFVDDFAGVPGFRMVDISHSVNESIWDDNFFSTLGADYSEGGGDDIDEAYPVEKLLSREIELVNRRHQFMSTDREESIGEILEGYEGNGHREISARIGIKGAFNVNSTSKESWKALLSSLARFEMPVLSEDGSEVSWETGDGVRLPRFGHPMQSVGWTGGDSPTSPSFWSGFRKITDEELDSLAENIVEEIRQRGPFRSLAEFVNRDPDSDQEEYRRKGVLQAALDKALNSSLVDNVGEQADQPQGALFSKAIEGNEGTAAGFAGYVLQSDVLQALAPIIQPRSDFFAVRAMGQSVDKSGKVVAVAVCEATVQRRSEYLDSADASYTATKDLKSEVNKDFGRRFQVVSFRWLATEEI